MGPALHAKLKLPARMEDWLVNRLKMNLRSLQWTISPIPAIAGQPKLPKETSTEHNWPPFWEGCDNLWNKITASETLSYSHRLSVFLYFFLFLSFSSLDFRITLERGSLSFLLSFSLLPWLCRMNLTKPFQGIKIPLQPTLTLRLPLYLSSLYPHCSCYCISRHSTCNLMGGKGKLN